MSDEDDIEPDPEIQVAIFNWLAYEIQAKYSTSFDGDVKFKRDIRKKRHNGELCLRCNTQPSKDYSPEKRWNDKGFCEPCLKTIRDAGEYCETCHYAFEKDTHMQTQNLCKLCADYGDAPRLNV
jgi:hypothetical protein